MRVWNYIVLMLTLIIFLEFVGFHTPAGSILNSLGIEISSTTSDLGEITLASSNLFGLLAVLSGAIAIGGTIIVGFFTKTFDWKLVVVVSIIPILILFVGTGVGIINYAISTGEKWLIAIVATIFLPMTAGFIWSVVDWFAGGND